MVMESKETKTRGCRVGDLLTKVTVPDGEKGNFRVENFYISEKDAKYYNISATFSGTGRYVTSGNYTRLKRTDGYCDTIMSDTSAEIRDHYEPVIMAHGRCLINGLGIGVVLQACLRKQEVEHVTVIELEQDVIDLVAPHYYQMFGDERLTVVCADAYEYMPPRGARYQMVWHDVWSCICADNWPLYGKLHRKYGRRADWQGSWVRDEVEREVRRSKREPRWGRF